ncbi:M20/M25/M40 family metallo-hydrolase [Agriterribacter sp.]|uniref:M28 family metallopeptidase n=1 Tax=Agriterribacter sp. TaxID=2821509 RepID=UPI002B72913E|nr:M20/M25/M40 family metallo-hydrolase [Agriterribacter sp.]HRO46123.1 M20/M25/M40 family metallo-hydrolase [Agriterribacter sp.]HRQ16184.1 M20/M25/M40 family metallo-hydrolase [Agriterribacter sp.]
MKKIIFFSFLMTCIFYLANAQEKIDQSMMQKIRNEGLNHSKVMDIAFQLTDVSGPRLTISPGFTRAANWAKEQLADWGLEHAVLEPWGEFGKGWELEKMYIAQTAPYYRPLIGFPKAWTSGTGGLKKAQVILVDAADSADVVKKYSGQLKDKIIIMSQHDILMPGFKPDARRYSDEELQEMTGRKPSTPAYPRPAAPSRSGVSPVALLNDVKEVAKKEGALAILTYSMRGRDGTLFVQGGGSYKKDDPENFTDVMVTVEDYKSIVRLLQANIPVEIETDIQTRFIAEDTKGYNVLADIKGTDKNLGDEVVMLGAHLDSWQGATGATDNAAGSAVMLEAVRILKTLGVQPRRTIRIALWSGEEQGLHGSRNYVKNHLADPATMTLKPGHAKVSAYFNFDNGTGKIRGIYLQGNEACRNIFSQWFAPFKDLDASAVTISNTGGTDHLAFDAVGIPGFQFIQDPIEYSTRTHHTNMDSYDHLLADDLKQAATIIAAFVYNAAMRDEKLPRKPLPKAGR